MMNPTFRALLQTLFIACCFVLYTAAYAQEPQAPPATPPETAPAEPAPPAGTPEAGTPPAEAPAEAAAEEEDPFAWDEGDRRLRRGDPVVAVGDDSTLAEDERAEAVVAVFGSSTAAGRVDEAVVAVFGDARATGTVGEAVVAVLGDAYVNNRVGEAVVAVLGSVELGPQANVGSVVVIGGTLKRHPDAVVRGGVQRILAGEIPGLSWLRPWARHALVLGRPLALEPGLGWAWAIAFAFLALYIGFALVFRDGVDRCVQTLESRPGQTILTAVLTALLTPIAIMVLLVSMIGIAAIPFLILGLFGATLFGKSVVLAWIGRRFTGFLGEEDTPLKHTAFAVAIGGLVVLALYLVPFLGFILFNAIAALGLGAVVYTMILSIRSSRRERAAAASARSGNGPPPPTAPGLGTTSGFADAGTAARTGGPDGFSATSGATPDAPNLSPGVAAGFAPGASESAASGATTPGAGAPPPGAAARTHTLSDAEAAALPRARFWIRMGALAIDVVMIAILFGMLNWNGDLWLLVLGAYGAVMWKVKGTTIGGIVFGLRVVRRDGRPMDWATAIVRALSCFLSMVVAGLGFIWIAIDDDKQGWHDKIAGTVVVTMPKGVSLL
jgi:uncharacterized RDD family membrane protein YckC